ncbi:MAG: helix-turn-helix domain-containing protein, partial [Planctomycetota bacterium]
AGLPDLRQLLEKAGTGTLLLEEAHRLTAHRRRALGELVRERGEARLLLGASGHRQSAAALAAEFDLPLLEQLPLAERREDVGPLAEHLLARDGGEGDPRTFAPEALATLEGYNWPGDEPELERCVVEAARNAKSDAVDVEDLPTHLRDLHDELAGRGTLRPAQPASHAGGGTHSIGDPFAGTIAFQIPSDGDLRLEMGEPLIIREALRHTGQNVKEAATLLGIGRSTLYRKLKEHGLR